jgi:hypothetical protein
MWVLGELATKRSRPSKASKYRRLLIGRPTGRDATRKEGMMFRAGEEPAIDQEEQQRYERARTRVKALKGFYIHATAFVLVNIALFALNVLVGGVWWFYWPLLGWGIGLGVHALAVFGFGGGGPWGRDWEERKIREMMDKEQGR